ncbi:MAG: YeeE/YedE thiosulfate transporter family protein [Myxococcota bacterium]
MENFTPIQSLLGGLLIGLASALVFLFNGRIAGVSGIAGGVLRFQRSDLGWRLLFVFGLLIGGAVWGFFDASAFDVVPRSYGSLIAAGLFVGVGTQLGSGCTSGHGICGLSRFSGRSLAAVLTFMVTAAITVALMHGPLTEAAR